jgi:IgA Peptidase M64.
MHFTTAALALLSFHVLPPSGSCKNLIVASAAKTTSSPSSSSSACLDSSTFLLNGHPSKNCEWVAKNPQVRCKKVVVDDTLEQRVDAFCPETCGSCSSTTSSNRTQRKVGEFCSNDGDCESWTCRENTCYASPTCKALKQVPGQEFDKDMVILVFVGSGFTDLSSWRMSVAKTFYAFKDFEFFDYSNPRYVAFYVDELDQESYCNFKCEGLETLLCCDVERMRRWTRKCFPPGINVNTIVIENSNEYGGGGYRYANMATTSTHSLGPRVAVHELGHSLFELADEYSTSQFGPSSANCDYEGCSKWADLDEHLGGGLCEMKGCRNGEFYIPGKTFMQFLDEPFGEVNTRYTCCTFLALTGGTPSYCDRFEFGSGLLEYCKNDYQGYGQIYDDNNNNYGRTDVDITRDSVKYVLVADAATLIFNTVQKTFGYDSDMNGEGPKLFKRRTVYGDYANMRAVIDAGVKKVKELIVEYESGKKRSRYYDESELVDVPPTNGTSAWSGLDAIGVEMKMLEIAVDARDGIVIDMNLRDLNITWWLMVKLWFEERWEWFKSLFRKKKKTTDTVPDGIL